MIKPKKSVENIEGYYVDLYPTEFEYKLDGNENVFGPSPKVVECIKNFDLANINYYPFYGKFLEKLAQFNQVGMDWLFNSNGADEALMTIINTYLDKGEKILTVAPTFVMPHLYAQIAGGEVIQVPLEKDFSFPLKNFLAQITDEVKIIYIASPNNPLGICVEENILEEVIKKASKQIVIIDETYANYAKTFNIDLVKKYDNVIITRSFSKDFALAGLRIGYGISNPQNILNIKKVISPYSTNACAVAAASAALEDLEHFEKIKAEIDSGKDQLTKFFTEQGFKVIPSCANFLCVDFQDKVDFVYDLLLSNSIKVKKYSSNSTIKTILRIGIPPQKGIKKIKDVLKKKPLLVFDMDGVLVDVSNSYRLAIEETFKYFAQKEISQEKISEAKNKGGLNNDWDLTEYLLSEEGFSPSKPEIIEVFQNIYWKNGDGLIKEEKFLLNQDKLKELKKQFNLAIFTGRPKTEAIFTLKLNGVERYFSPIITMDDLPFDKQKPNPDGIEKIKESTIYSEVIYFGDTPDDMKCAKAANVKAVGVLPPKDKSEILKNLLFSMGADKVIENINNFELE